MGTVGEEATVGSPEKVESNSGTSARDQNNQGRYPHAKGERSDVKEEKCPQAGQCKSVPALELCRIGPDRKTGSS